jgi:hypothetical protein
MDFNITSIDKTQLKVEKDLDKQVKTYNKLLETKKLPILGNAVSTFYVSCEFDNKSVATVIPAVIEGDLHATFESKVDFADVLLKAKKILLKAKIPFNYKILEFKAIQTYNLNSAQKKVLTKDRSPTSTSSFLSKTSYAGIDIPFR